MNRLQYETSPYLLQHQHNPVDWYPWGNEALQKAKDENKIILVSIGYSACHWCHVMERESFENEETAKLMNDFFINIKIDREERPDLDHIYMDAVQTMTGSGGWPLNVFLTPDTKPFYGGTYFPPVNAYNRSSWREVLHGVHKAWKDRSNEIIAQAEELTEHLTKSSSIGISAIKLNTTENLFTQDQCHAMFQTIMKQADETWGGYGNAPKFPQTATTNYLLQYAYFANNQQALQQALLTIDKIIDGGINDHIGGGFARYSTDKEWLAPHFEKMLYDNALLLCNFADAYAITQKEKYKQTIEKTIAFLQREMLSNEGLYYAAVDADSEGEEGKFYVWQKAEIEEILGENATLFSQYYDVTEHGNWEEKNILRNLETAENVAQKNNLTLEQFSEIIENCSQQLLLQRNKRTRPQTDDKILLGWNALLITALCKCATSLSSKEFEQMAINCWQLVLDKFAIDKNANSFYHTYKNNTAKYPAFLDDYAYLIQAAIQLQELTSNTQYLDKAYQIAQYVIENFSDENQQFFYFTPKNQQDVIIKKTEIYDGATPSGNAVMAQNLIYLGIVFNKPDWTERSLAMLKNLENVITKHPISFGVWASIIINHMVGINEISLIGKNYQLFNNELLKQYLPNKIVQAASTSNNQFPLLANKPKLDKTLIYPCKNYSCQQPFASVSEMVKYLQNTNKF